MPAGRRSPPSSTQFKSLQYFLNRSQALAQYKEFMRITQPLAEETRRDVRQQIRAAFDMYRDVQDEKQAVLLVRQGKEQLKHVSDLVDSAVAQQRLAQSQAAATPSDTWTDVRVTNSEDGDEQEDVRGRVGLGWPWKKDAPVKKIELEGIKRR